VRTFASIRNHPTRITGRPRGGRTCSPWGIADASAPSAKLLTFGFDITDDGASHYHLNLLLDGQSLPGRHLARDALGRLLDGGGSLRDSRRGGGPAQDA